MKSETIGQRVQRLRLGRGLTQKRLAEAAGVPLASLQNWEIDHREPGFRHLGRLARALGVPLEGFLDTRAVEKGERQHRPAGPSRRPGRLTGIRGKTPARTSNGVPPGKSKPKVREKGK